MSTADQVTIERNLKIARRFIEGVLGGKEPAAFVEIVHPDVVVDTGLKPGGKINGAAEYGAVLTHVMGSAFSNATLAIKDIAALTDGRVLVRFEASADNTGDLNGVKATGKRFTFCELHLMRFENGKLIENWVGALNPLMFEIWQAPASAPLLLGDKS